METNKEKMVNSEDILTSNVEDNSELSFINEDWKWFSGRYLVSNYGRIKSLAVGTLHKDGKKTTHKQRILKTQLNRIGYVTIRIILEKKMTLKIHRLVAKLFINDFKESLQVNHIDGNKENNHISNLEMVNNSENQLHAYRIGLNNIRYGEDVGNSVMKTKDVLIIKSYLKNIERYKSGNAKMGELQKLSKELNYPIRWIKSLNRRKDPRWQHLD